MIVSIRRFGLSVVAVLAATCALRIRRLYQTAEYFHQSRLVKSFNSTDVLGLKPRAFTPWAYSHADLCEQEGFDSAELNPRRHAPMEEGLMFVKLVKTGSSTVNGVNLRIARNMARRLNRSTVFCPTYYRHTAASISFAKRNPRKSFLWTVIREPTSRVQSHYFHFNISRGKEEPSDIKYQQFALGAAKSHYRSVLPLTKRSATNSSALDHVQSVLDDYNFVGITERLDESFVVLQMLLNLPVEDILYLNAKTSGGYDDGLSKRFGVKHCVYIIPKFTSPGMMEFFSSGTWDKAIQHERALYAAVNRSLDLTIDSLGRQKFSRKLKEYRDLLAKVQAACQERTVFPCLPNGERSREEDRDCLWNDAGCGASCIDDVIKQ